MHGAFLLGSCRKNTGSKCDINMSREAVGKQLFRTVGNYGIEPAAVNLPGGASGGEFAT